MNSRKKLIAVGVVVIGALAYLLVSGFAGHSLHDAEVSEIVNNPSKFQGKGIKVSGTVMSGSVTKAQLDLAFDMKDKNVKSPAINDANIDGISGVNNVSSIYILHINSYINELCR